MKVVIDHVRGSRSGQRQEFAAAERVRFGRHPDNEVSFDAHRDLDASSRHAELRPAEGGGLVLVDIGSSNGTFVDGEKISRRAIALGTAAVAEFGVGGPRVRIAVVTSDADLAALEAMPAVLAEAPRRRWVWALVAAAVLLAVVAVVLLAR